MLYQTIFEIGPIYHYVQNSRKTMDVWGSSFLFSYVMGHLIKKIVDLQNKNIEQVIKLPFLQGDYLYNWIVNGTVPKKGIAAGTIPDQIFCLHEDAELPQKIFKEFKNLLSKLFDESKKSLNDKLRSDFKDKNINNNIIIAQLSDYFRLFWVSKSVETYQNQWSDLLQAISARGHIYPFTSYEDKINEVYLKSEKCTLCGDYKAVIELKGTRRNKKPEELCAICTIKRGLLLHLQERLNLNRFRSTTSIAATIVQKVLNENYDALKGEIVIFVKNFLNSEIIDEELIELEGDRIKNLLIDYQTKKIIEHLPYEIFFGDYDFSKKFRTKIKNTIQNNKTAKVWMDHGYYAIVSMDGDNTGQMFTSLNEEKVNNLSAAIAEFSNMIPDILDRYHGQLIYSGGEDTLFVIHPKFILSIMKEFSELFKSKMQPFVAKNSSSTISAGAFICPHKYPLKLALQGAEKILEKAKGIPGKNTLAIKLVKGVGVVNETFLKIQNEANYYSLESFVRLIGKYQQSSISRGFLYKLKDEYDVYKEIICNEEDLIRYVRDTFEKTKQKKITFSTEMETLILNSYSKNNGKVEYDSLMDRLYLARFLTGGE